ncbi:dimethylmenaquinone methyltransferase, partial [Burkholderia sp. Cy-647]|nr:dimethylmenaquinone methyltransferase [Burkholderia sp. Cy-647]
LKASVPSVGRPISLAGTPVAAGDLVVADDDGVVVIPAERAQAVLAEGQARADKEARMMAALARGETTLDLLGLSQWRAAR